MIETERRFHARLAQIFELFFGLDALGRRHGAKALRQRQRRGDHGLAIAPAKHALRKGLVDLDLVERKIGQIVYRRVPRAKIVQGYGDPEVFELPDRDQVRFLILEKRGFGYLQLQPFRRKTGLHQGTEYDVEEIALFELNRRDIDRDLDVLRSGLFRGCPGQGRCCRQRGERHAISRSARRG